MPGARVVAYHGYPQSLALTLGHAVPVVDYVGELASDVMSIVVLVMSLCPSAVSMRSVS